MADLPELFTDGLADGHRIELDRFVKALAERYPVVLKNEENFESIEAALRDFEIVRPYRLLSILNYLQVDLGGSLLDLFFIAVNYTFVNPANADNDPGRTDVVLTDHRIAGYCQLKNPLGHVLIKPKSSSDFISELFKSVEMEFQGFDDFNRSYHVLTDAPEILKKVFPPEAIGRLQALHDVHFEAIEDVCLAFQDRNLTADSGMELVEMFKAMADGNL